ncbi:MAG: dTDP-6-deoxy-L-hexose 3-O-methyltransferase, partial [Methylomarinum sp.]|nr:dTDP-6-deoxy-L-hexose 3-O-methyltransferase [Methylomarinum sp.]
SPFSRKIIGFDAFGEFPKQKEQTDAKFIQEFEGVGGFGISVEELETVFSHKSFKNYELIKGDIVDTIPEYISEHPELKIALLHVDVDVYAPSVTILENLFEKVVRGGLVVFDDYGTVSGETRAVDDFFVGKGVQIEKLPISHIPAYIRKK